MFTQNATESLTFFTASCYDLITNADTKQHSHISGLCVQKMQKAFLRVMPFETVFLKCGGQKAVPRSGNLLEAIKRLAQSDYPFRQISTIRQPSHVHVCISFRLINGLFSVKVMQSRPLLKVTFTSARIAAAGNRAAKNVSKCSLRLSWKNHFATNLAFALTPTPN